MKALGLGEPYWAAAEAGQLVYLSCPHCGHGASYPKEACPLCGSRPLEWKSASGHGTVHSFSVIYRPPSPKLMEYVPYVLALVDLPEGVRRLTWIVDCPPDEVRIGMQVHVTFRELGGKTIPCFGPVRTT